MVARHSILVDCFSSAALCAVLHLGGGIGIFRREKGRMKGRLTVYFCYSLKKKRRKIRLDQPTTNRFASISHARQG